MSVTNGQPASATVFNNAFVSKDTDSTMTSQLTLNRTASGAQVTDVQAQINANLTAITANTANISTNTTNLSTHTTATTGVHGATGAVVGDTDSITLTNKTFDDEITIQEISTPSTPASGYGAIYFKSDGNLYQIDDTGTETNLTSTSNTGYAAKTAAYTITDSDNLGTIKTSGTTITLPTPGDNIGRVIRIKYVAPSSNTDAWVPLEVIRDNSSDTIDGIDDSYFVNHFNEEVTILCAATNEYLLLS